MNPDRVNPDARGDTTDLRRAEKVHGVTPGANSAAEVLAELIDGYAELDTEGRLEARLRHAAGVKLRVTAQLVSAAAEPLPDDERETLLASPWEPPTISVWTPPVPLVLFDVFFSPFTARAKPRGNVRWLRPSRERPYLTSLADLGVLSARSTR